MGDLNCTTVLRQYLYLYFWAMSINTYYHILKIRYSAIVGTDGLGGGDRGNKISWKLAEREG